MIIRKSLMNKSNTGYFQKYSLGNYLKVKMAAFMARLRPSIRNVKHFNFQQCGLDSSYFTAISGKRVIFHVNCLLCSHFVATA